MRSITRVLVLALLVFLAQSSFFSSNAFGGDLTITTTRDKYVENNIGYDYLEEGSDRGIFAGYADGYGASTAVLHFSLNGINRTIQKAELKIFIKVADRIGGTPYIDVWGSNEDNWVETDSSIPVEGVPLYTGHDTTGIADLQWKTFDVTSFINDQMPVDKEATFILRGPVTGNSGDSIYVVFYDRTMANGQEAQLEITYVPQVSPTVTTDPTASGISVNEAAIGGNVTSDGGAAVTERGIVYSTNANPTTADSKKVADTNGTGAFSVNLSGLTPGTTYHARAYAINSVGTNYGADITFTTLTVPTVSTDVAVGVLMSTGATIGGNVTSDGGATVTERGIVYSTNTNPTTSDFKKAASTGGTGTFSVDLSGLQPGTTYHARAYAINSVGTNYGADITFTTLTLPTVSTDAAASGITGSGATIGGNVSADGGDTVTERGIVYSTGSNPTTADSKEAASTGGTGTFSVDLSGLQPGTMYHARAYATNSVGTNYGADITFTTLVVMPTVSTDSIASGITSTGATIGGNVTADGGATVTERGIVYSTNLNPTTGDTKEAASTGGTGVFNVDLSGLQPGTTYHARAYAINSVGTNYGADITFTTLTLPTVSTDAAASGITGSGATIGGNVSADGGDTVTERGIVYSTGSNPTTADSKEAASTGGTGTFSVILSGLQPGTTYHARAYATNSVGTNYGADITFTTLVVMPTVSTDSAASGITSTGAAIGGNVTAEGGATVTERGIVYSTNANPTTADSKEAASTGGTGAFSVNLSGLTPGMTYHARAYAINSAGTNYGGDVTFTTLTMPTVSTDAVASNITGAGATIGGNVAADGGATVTERGIVYSTTPDPTIGGTKIAASTGGTGIFSVILSGLQPGTTYHARAYATNSVGTNYGADITFTTLVVMPTVSTDSTASGIISTGATIGGNVTADGGATVTERGIVYSTNLNPTTGDTKVAASTGGIGVFSVSLSGLQPGTTYHARAYAINSAGTNYGDDVTFAAAIVAPTVSSDATASNITGFGATIGGNVTAEGGAAVTERGIVYSTNLNPTTGDTKVAASAGGTGTFSVDLSGLQPGTTYHARAYATNSVGTNYGADITFTTLVVLPTVSTDAAASWITSTGATIEGNVTMEGGATVTERGIVYSTIADPTTADSKEAASSGGTGVFSVNLSGLTPGMTYHARAYAINSAGTNYGDDVTFTTLTMPTVSTEAAANNITGTGATIGGNVTAEGGATVTERGIVYATSPNPTTGDTKVAASTGGIGTFSVDLSGLQPGTTYHARAYATNSAGTSYGADITFITLVVLPTVSTDATASGITSTGATIGGNVTAEGGVTVTERGIVYSSSPNPTIGDTKIAASSGGTGTFSVTLSGLTTSTIYHVRAYAINSVGTNYGTDITFTTSGSGGGSSGGGGGGSSPSQSNTPITKTVISPEVRTDADKNLDESLAKTGEANVSVSNEKAAKISPKVVDILARENKPITVQNDDIALKFAPESLVTPQIKAALTGPAANLEIGVKEVSPEEKAKILAQAKVGETTGLYEVGGKLVNLTAQITRTGGGNTTSLEEIKGFNEPVAITIDLSKENLKDTDIANLTGVRYQVDGNGNITLVKLGGTYDPNTKMFTFYTDRFSLYGVLRADNIKQISLTIGDEKVVLGSQTKTIDAPPMVIEGRTEVPIRVVAEGLGAKVDWNQDSQSVTIKMGDKILNMAIGQTGPGLDVPPVIVNNRVMVPIRYVSESLGAQVMWFAESKRVFIVN